MDSCPIPRFLKFAIFAKIANCQYASFVVSFKFFARPLHVMNPLPNSPISQNMSFSQNPQLSTCLFCHPAYIFAKLVIFIKLSFVKMPLFVISFVFGQTLELSVFAEICRFRLNLPFSYNRHLSSFPSLSPHLSFCQTFDGFLPNHPFSQFANFVKSPTVNIAGLHLTSRRPFWWSRTKAFVSAWNQALFSC